MAACKVLAMASLVCFTLDLETRCVPGTNIGTATVTTNRLTSTRPDRET